MCSNFNNIGQDGLQSLLLFLLTFILGLGPVRRPIRLFVLHLLLLHLVLPDLDESEDSVLEDLDASVDLFDGII